MRFSHSTIILTLFCFLFLSSSAMAAGQLSVRHISTQDWQQLTADKGFSYRHDVEKDKKPDDTSKNGFMLFLMKALRFLTILFNATLLWVIAGIIAIYVIYKLLLNNDSILLKRRKRKLSENEEQQDSDNIHDTNWDVLLQKAARDHDLQAAVRYSYMWLLQMLQE